MAFSSAAPLKDEIELTISSLKCARERVQHYTGSKRPEKLNKLLTLWGMKQAASAAREQPMEGGSKGYNANNNDVLSNK